MTKRMTGYTMRLLALALGLGIAATGWAAGSLEETGATVPTTATLAFKGAKLSQVTADTLSAAFCGSSAGAATGAAVTFNNFDRSSEATGTITCQAQVADDGYIKSVLLSLTQSGSDINVQKTGAKYVSGTAVGPSTAAGSDGNYDIARLKLALAKPAPLAVFDGASGGFKKSSVNGVTFAANGNTVADDGSYVKISTSVGALFKLDASYEFVVGEFTVTNLNESAAADRALVLWSPSEDGTSTSSPGVMLKGGTVETRGVWSNALWGDDKTELNSTLKTGVPTLTQRTFVLTTEDSKIGDVTDNATGTHLFELTGANPGTAVYGGTGSMGLRGNQTYRTLVIGGPAAGSLSAMTDLVITKVVIYASNGARQFTSTDPTTIANVENPAAFYVGNEETINASTINAGVEAFGSAYVYTEAGATLNLDAALMGRATFAGSISGVPIATRGLTLGSVNDKVTLTNEAYDPVLKGVGTVVYPDNTIPSASSIWLKSSEWAGTLSLSGIQGSSSGQPGWYAPFHNYGSANSTIKVSGFTGFFAAGNFESPAALEIAAGSTFTLNNGNGGNSMTFAKLKGSGDIVICGDNSPAIQYVMRDASEFAGNITVSQSGSSTFKKSIVLGGGSSYNYSTGKYQKQICVLGNVTIAAGKTWTADSGIVVDGTLTLAASDSSMPAVASGTGKIVCNNKVPNNSGLTASTWTGTLEINADTTSGTISGSTQFMNAASKLNLAEGYLSLTGVSELPGEVSVASGAILYLGKTDATTASVKVGTLGGAISTQGATSLETLTLDLGTARTFDWTKINQGNNQNLTVNISLTEGAGENGTTVFIPANFNGNNTYNYTIKHIDGTAIAATPVINGETGAVTFTYIPQVDGDACWHAYEFNSTYTSSNVHYYPDSVSTDQRDCRTWDYADPDLFDDTDPDKGGNKFIYTIICPGPNKAYDYPTEWSAAIRCTTPSTANSIIVAFGNSNAGNYIALVSGDTAGKVRLVSGSGSNPVGEITSMTVANPTTSQHVYVFTKTASAVTVYCDGDLIVTKPLSLSIGSGFQFGTIYGGTQNGCGLSRVSSRETAGMVDYTRLYDFAISSDMIQKLAEDDPYVSSTPTYSREVSGSPWWYTGEGTWLKSDDSTLVGVPDVAGIVDLTATADATMNVNLPAAPVYEKLTLQGAGAVTLVKNGNSPKIATAKLVVKTNVTAPYDIADFSGARVSVDAGKVLTFDFTSYTFEGVTGVTTQQVTGIASRADDRFDISSTAAWASRLNLIYDADEYTYSVVIDPAATVTKNNTTVAYPTAADALTALATDAGTIRLFVDYDQDIALSAGQTLVSGNFTTGNVTGPNGYEVVNNSGTYTLVDNTASTWSPGENSDNNWGNRANWSTGYLPSQYTVVTFPASESAHVVNLTLNNANSEAERHRCASMVLNGDVTFQRGGNEWAYVFVYGNVTGTGTLTFEQTGLNTPANSSIAVSCPVVGNAAANDNFFSGTNATYTFSAAVDIAQGEFKADYANLVFNGPVTIRNGGYVKSNHESASTTFNGGINVPAGASASLTVVNNGGQHTIASTVTLGAGATFTIPTATTVSGATFTAASGYEVVQSASGNNTVYTTKLKGATVSDVSVSYGADYASATVTATVSDTTLDYYISWASGEPVKGSVSGSQVTFDVSGINHTTEYQSADYTITAKDGETAVTTTGGSGTSVAADTTPWFSHDSSGLIGGNWSTAVDLAEPAEVSDNTFTPTATPSSNDVVVLEFDVCFKSVSDDDVDNEAQAAIKIGEVDSSPTFMVLTNGNSWAAVSAQGITPDPAADYKVVLTMNYTTHTYGATVNGVDLKDAQNSAIFSMAKSDATGTNSLEFRGTGTLASMKGDQLDGNMVADAAGNKYFTIADAIAAVDAGTAVQPLTLLHAGTVPAGSGWEIVDNQLVYTAKAAVFIVTDNGATTNDVTYYSTLADAIAAATNGCTVLLLDNVTLDARIEPNVGAGTTLTIDLGGKTIARTGTSGNGSAFDVKSGDVLIMNGEINCTQDDTAIVADGVYAITSRSGSNVTLANLNITVNSECGACVYPFAGSTMTIESGTYANTTTTPYRYNTAITGMAVNQPNNSTQCLFIKGGSFSQYDPQLGDDSGAMTDFTDEGFVAIDDGNGHFVVQPGYNVTFDANGGTPTPDAQRVAAGGLVTAPATSPTKAGDYTVVYTFNAWQLNNADYNFAVAPTADITLVANYTETSLGAVTWIGGASGDWMTAANWDIGYVPTRSSVVTFTNNAEVGIYHGDSVCKELVLNGANVTIVRANQGSGYTGSVDLHFQGNEGRAVSGTGTLGLNTVGLFNNNNSGALTIGTKLDIQNSVTFKGVKDNNANAGSWTVTGKTTIANVAGLNVKCIDDATTTFQGDIDIASGAEVTFLAGYGTGNHGAAIVVASGSKVTLAHNVGSPATKLTLDTTSAHPNGTIQINDSQVVTDDPAYEITHESNSYKATLKAFTVTFTWNGGSSVETYTYGTPKANVYVPADPASYVDNGMIYTFIGWSDEVPDTITSNVTITAQYSSAAAKATVFTVTDEGATTNDVAYYSTLAGAIAAAQSGQTVVLLDNVTVDARILVNESMTIDLGGKTITRTAAPAGDNGSVFRVDGNCDVTIRNGAIDCRDVDDSLVAADGVYALDAKNGADLTLADLAITVNSECGACVYPWANSTVTIESGTYANLTTTPYRYHTAWTGMAVNQANVASKLLIIKGGSFSKVDPQLGDDSTTGTDAASADFTAPGFVAIDDGNGHFVVQPGYNVTFVNYDGTVLEKQRVLPNQVPSYKGETPTKPESEYYTYAFNAWTPEIVAATADATYTATFTETPKNVAVTVVVPTNSTVVVKSGDTPVTPDAETGYYVVPYGTELSIKYVPDASYIASGTTSQTVVVSGDGVTESAMTVSAPVDYVAVYFGWVYEAYDHPGYTGSWSNEVSYSEGKIAITDGNTYTADRPSDGRIVTLEMTMSFDDANDEDEDLGEVKTAVKLGTQGFRVYTSEGPSGAVTSVWKTVEIEGLELLPTANQDYTFLFVLDLTNKTYTASLITNGGVATNALALAGSTNIQFACRSNTAPVQRVEFVGSGTVTSIFGDYEDREIVLEFVDGQTIENVTLNAAQAAWLNGQDSYDALAEKIATMTQASFSDAYLLNLNILSDQYDGTYSFKVTGITVTDDKVTVTVELVRKAALTGGINGTLKLNGGATLPASGFTTLQSVDIGDEDFSEGNSTTCIFTKGEGGEKFFQPVIVAPANE